MFSSRLQADLAPNRLAAALERLRADNRPFVDFTLANPTRAGFAYPEDLLAPLGDRRGLVYSPEPLGSSEARRAVADDYARRGLTVDPERLVLTACTSEAYSLLFKVLCDAGDEVLVPRPSYPLFEHLTRLDDVAVKLYDLEYHGAWMVDVESVARALGPRTRALLIVTPNNPTGSFVKRDEFEKIAELCADRHVAIVADEVFADYELIEGASAAAARVLAHAEGLVFSLGGLSKSVGLPQVKIGWMAVAGGDRLVRDALGRLELACDSYLSVSTPAQLALPELLVRGAPIRAQIQARVAANYRSLIERADQTPSCNVLRSEGGWYAVVQVPTLSSEEDLVVELLERHGILVHPGYFFDFVRESFLVISLLVPEARFGDGLTRLFRHFDCTASASGGGTPRETENKAPAATPSGVDEASASGGGAPRETKSTAPAATPNGVGEASASGGGAPRETKQ